MKSFLIVFKFELLEMLKKKALIISTLVLVILALVLTSIPSIALLFSSDTADGPNEPGQSEEVEKVQLDVSYVFENPADYGVLSQIVAIDSTYETEDKLREAIIAGDVKSGFVIDSLSSFKYITLDQSMYDMDFTIFEETLRSIKIATLFEENNIDHELVMGILQTPIESETISIGKNQALGMPIAMGIMLVMYMLILLYGNGVSTSVAREKDSRTMELLITSTNTGQLIMGKVLAAGVAGILQMGTILLAAFIGFTISKGNYPELVLVMLQGEMSLDVITVYALFSISGYILYLFIYAALGSLVSKVEDVAGVTSSITMVFVIAYIVATMAMQMPDSAITSISSYIPFVSIFTMPIRYMLTTVSVTEVLMSLAIMIATCFALSILSIKIYRYGSLNYGNKLKFSRVIKDLIQDSRK